MLKRTLFVLLEVCRWDKRSTQCLLHLRDAFVTLPRDLSNPKYYQHTGDSSWWRMGFFIQISTFSPALIDFRGENISIYYPLDKMWCLLAESLDSANRFGSLDHLSETGKIWFIASRSMGIVYSGFSKFLRVGKVLSLCDLFEIFKARTIDTSRF